MLWVFIGGEHYTKAFLLLGKHYHRHYLQSFIEWRSLINNKTKIYLIERNRWVRIKIDFSYAGDMYLYQEYIINSGSE